MAQYLKAYICSYEENRPNLGTRFYVQFNPTELSVDEAIGVREEEGTDMERFGKQFLAGGIGWQYPEDMTLPRNQKKRLTLSTTLFFNTLNDLYQDSYEDVRQYVRKLYPYTNKTVDSKSKIKQIYFFWGSIAVAGILTRLNVRYTMFAPDGKPVRAQAEISIVGDYVGEESGKTPTSASSGKITGFVGGDIKTAADTANWRQEGIVGNPRL